MEPIFTPFAKDLVFEEQGQFASRLHCLSSGELTLPETSHFFGYVLSGSLGVNDFMLRPDMYFSITGPAALRANGDTVIMERIGYRGLFQIGWNQEKTGRLKYINDCSTTILVHPPKVGDPVLNDLIFPPLIRQSAHTHPSLRFGLVVAGSGYCELKDEEIPLKRGMVFYLPANTRHNFVSRDNGLRVVAFHPDSDVGPTDDLHPMLSRTILERTR